MPTLNRDIAADESLYAEWKERKLAQHRDYVDRAMVTIQDPLTLRNEELAALAARVAALNFAIYRVEDSDPLSHDALKSLCSQVGLRRLVRNPFAKGSGITELGVASIDSTARSYIPYTPRALNWHTDGYYNEGGEAIRGMALHCIRDAGSGGENQFLDHELMYLLVREQDPGLAAALFHPQAMTIPAGMDSGGEERKAQTGPVFAFDTDGYLRMRYTRRKRHISWHPSDQVQSARDLVDELLTDTDSPWVLNWRLRPGEGVLSNNILHNRSSFEDREKEDRARLMLRARFHDRIDFS